MQNIAEFRIIGRIGKIEVKEKVTYLSVASNYNRKDGDDWKTDAHWNSVTLFDKLAKRLTGSKGHLVHIFGRVSPNQNDRGGSPHQGLHLTVACTPHSAQNARAPTRTTTQTRT